MKFVHLHNHTEYSILDGAITVPKLINRAIELDMPAIAMTDHGNMYGAVEFYQSAKKAGIKPIIGQEFYMAPGSRFKKEFVKDSGEEKSYHLLMLAKNREGYQNLMKLSSIGFIEGFYYKPRIDMEVLQKYSKGLIVGSACIAGQIPVLIRKGRLKEARELAGQFNEIFGQDHFYLEMQDHGIQEQHIVNAELIKMSSELNIPLIATNDAHYVKKEDAYAHEILLCVQTGRTLNDTNRMRFHGPDFYLKSHDEMAALFADYPDAIYNTAKISEMIDLQLDLGNPVLPDFEVPDGFDLDSYLKHLVIEGAKERYSTPLSDEVIERIEYELSVIKNMEFPGYFLIVWDVIKQAKIMGVPVGPGRGSAAGSIVAYSLGITALDPLKYNLLFERFLNPDRNEMPDIDIDFCADRREEVIDYVKEKYGDDHVSQIITFNRMMAKAVVKDVARVMDVPFAESNQISKLIEEKNLTLSIGASKELQQMSRDENLGKELIEISLKLEGLARSAGKHAAGVVISKGPLTDYVPLYRDSKEGGITSQYEKNTLEQAGLVKMDFLGLKNLSIIDKCLKLIKASTGEDVDIDNVHLDDKETYDLLQRADTKGVFQLESGGMQNVLRRLRPTEFEDIIAIVALYRPGPLGSGMTEDFITRKRNADEIKYPHDTLIPVLKDTLGVVVYQEQVMLISQIIGGFTLPEADKLRKAMGKKKMDLIDALEKQFLDGAEAKSIDRKIAEDLYNMIKKFGEYGFNKSHSAAYAVVTYQTAYLKAHYPIQYMAALLSAAKDKSGDIANYTNDCKTSGIQVKAPSINASSFDFTIEEKTIRFALGAVKGIGEKAIENIVLVREEDGPFTSIKNFLERVGPTVINKGVLEALVKSGSFDEHHDNRAQLFASIDLMLDTARRLHEDKISGQGDLFSMGADGEKQETDLDFPDIKEWHDNEKLLFEKEVLGLYISGHPLARYEDEIRRFSSYSISELKPEMQGRDVTVVGIINDFQVRRSQKNGRKYGLGEIEDLEGTLDLLVFGKVVERHEDLLLGTEPVVITGSLEVEEEIPKKIICRNVVPLKDFRRQSISAIHIQLNMPAMDDITLNSLKDTFLKHGGDCPIYIHVDDDLKEKIVKTNSSFNITPTEQFVKDVSSIIGQNAIRYSIGHRH